MPDRSSGVSRGNRTFRRRPSYRALSPSSFASTTPSDERSQARSSFFLRESGDSPSWVAAVSSGSQGGGVRSAEETTAVYTPTRSAFSGGQLFLCNYWETNRLGSGFPGFPRSREKEGGEDRIRTGV